ncbi:MAG: Rdx family protein [Armatimonadota bacterium]|nr:Rdx family protein [Armatimonadota bacterium]MCX7777545.1 Rdx family protein [Armatimonadota bacterium]MDW8025554.1 Rdx family protein [Armatimonadota bacterium]
MDRAASLAASVMNALLDGFEKIELYPASGGRFEVRVDGELIFDKQKEGRFPEAEEIIASLRRRLK